MSSSAVNLTLQKGTTFEASFVLTGDDGDILNFTNLNSYGYIKKYPTSPIQHNLVVGINTDIGEVSISMGSSLTKELFSGRNYFDVFVDGSEDNFDFVSRIIYGTIIVEDTSLS
jgi:hypothetical protein